MKLLNTSLSTAVAFAAYLSIFNTTPTCNANTANPNPVIEEQSDGTLIEVKLHGDENSQYVTDDAGYTISKSDDGIYYYDVMSDSGGLVQTGIRADSGNSPEVTEPGGSSKSSKKGIKPTQVRYHIYGHFVHMICTHSLMPSFFTPLIIGMEKEGLQEEEEYR